MQKLTVEQALDAIGPGWPESCPRCDTRGRHTMLDGDNVVEHVWDGGRSLVHTMSGPAGVSFGADWDREALAALLHESEGRLFFTDALLAFGHQLVVFRDNRRSPLYVQTVPGWAP